MAMDVPMCVSTVGSVSSAVRRPVARRPTRRGNPPGGVAQLSPPEPLGSAPATAPHVPSHGRRIARAEGANPSLIQLWREHLEEGRSLEPRTASTDTQLALRNAVAWCESQPSGATLLPFTVVPIVSSGRDQVLLWASTLALEVDARSYVCGLEWGPHKGWHVHGVLSLRHRVDRSAHLGTAWYRVHYGAFSKWTGYCRTPRVHDVRPRRRRANIFPWLVYLSKDGLVFVHGRPPRGRVQETPPDAGLGDVGLDPSSVELLANEVLPDVWPA